MPGSAPPAGPLLVISSFPNETAAAEIASKLVEEKLAACVSLLPGAKSIYHWEGSIQSEEECLALMKSTAQAYPNLEARLLDLHPYETPEILAVDVLRGSPSYLEWLSSSLHP